MISRATAVAVALTFVLAGCGGGDESSDAGQPEASGPVETWPSCADVWVTGETLPEDYEGCVVKGNEVKVYSPGPCPSGAGYAEYESRFYTVPGDPIQESKSGDVFSDKAFMKFATTC